MIPTQQPSKRKATDDANPLAATAGKKLKREASKAGASNKRKLNGEEQPGGLVIVRAPAPTNNALRIEPIPPEPRAPSRPPSAQPQPQSQPQAHSRTSRPPAKKLRADGTSRAVGKGKDREVCAATPEVDEDVRQMQSETDTLRRKSQAQAASSSNADVQFPPRTPRPPPRRDVDTTAPLAEHETPQIEKNKIMREETEPRRTSSVNRGKRASSSYETTGVIYQPHTSVSVSSFFKHIDCALPGPQRARQLLIWCSNRAMNELADQTPRASSSRRTSTNSGKDPPPLSTELADVLKRAEENLMRMLADRNVDLNVYGGGGSQNGDASQPRKANEQNTKNRAREARFNGHIQRSKQEADAWKELSDSYDSHRKSVQAEMEKRKRALAAAKSKGKERASAEDLDDWDVERRDLPEQFLSSGSVETARGLVSRASLRESPLQTRLNDLEHTMDLLHTFANSAIRTTRVSEAELDRRYALLNISLASRSQPITHVDSTSLSSYIPPSRPQPPVTDPQDVLRALSRVDADRPQTQVGDAARRAVREVQRAADATAGMAERRLTGVPPPTPRKPPGTPRRATTPGKGR